MTEPFIIPSLNTERLLLRAFEKDDLDPFAAMVSNLEVMQRATYDGTTMTRTQAWNWLCLMLGTGICAGLVFGELKRNHQEN